MSSMCTINYIGSPAQRCGLWAIALSFCINEKYSTKFHKHNSMGSGIFESASSMLPIFIIFSNSLMLKSGLKSLANLLNLTTAGCF